MKQGSNLEKIVIAIISVIAVGAIAVSIVACSMYGNKPITEIPTWALVFMFNMGK